MRSPLWLLTAALLGLAASLSPAAPPAPAPVTLPLWPGAAPGALGTGEKDTPTLTVFLPDPDRASGAAFVICPGGGYAHLSPGEGAGYAQWLAENGIAGIVLKYRLGSNGYRHPVMLEDATRAMRLTRSRAAEWHVDPARIGIMGSSAGGHLASALLTHFDAGNGQDPDPVEQQSSRPDLGVLCYAVITMSENTHGGSRTNLLGPTPSPELVHETSSETQVRVDTPPCFVWHTWEDQTVKVENALNFAAALREKKVRFELHVYEKGGHGMGLGKGDAPGGHHRWTSDLLAWLGERGWLKKEPAANVTR